MSNTPTFNFDTPPLVRRGSGCVKWDEEPADDILPMWVADMDFATAPCIIEALRRRVEHGAFGYTLVGDDYYDAITDWFARRHHWNIDRSWIQYTTGVVPALSVVVKALTQPGDKVVLQTPVYNCFFSSVRNNGCEVLENRLHVVEKRWQMDLDDLERQLSDPRCRLLVLCNPHNPVGRVWTREELQQLADICRRHGVVVVSDEIHNELTYCGRRYCPYGTVDMDNAVILTSPSKSFNTAGLQIANIICANADWRTRIDRAINDNEVCDVNPFGVAALIAAYNEGEPWLDALCDYIYENYNLFMAYMAMRLPYLPTATLEGTYLVWVNIKQTGLISEQVAQRLLHTARVHVNPGTMYGIDDPERGNAGEGFIRINLACPRSQLLQALRRMEPVLAIPGYSRGIDISAYATMR